MSPDKVSAVAAPPLKKERHIVSWTPEEDDLLREQVSIHGTDNWTGIASKFKDKTSRQCRRRWYTYLNTEGKKGGWSQEEDMILCEAQKIFGNRWTEIAKVVSGRTDNAVKNRFSTLCKKRAKHETLLKENSVSCVNSNNKRVILQNGSVAVGMEESLAPVKQTRYQTSCLTENCNPNEMLTGRPEKRDMHLRPPLSELVPNVNSMTVLPSKYHFNDSYTTKSDSNNKIQGTFLKRDDPKITALLQQAELLSSLALKVNSQNTNQDLEDVWKELQNYLIQTEGGQSTSISCMEALLDDFRDLIDDLNSSRTEEQAKRQPDLHEESQGSSEYSTGSIQQSQEHRDDKPQTEDSFLDHGASTSYHLENELDSNTSACQGLSSSEEPKRPDGNLRALPNSGFDSPIETVPTFQSLTEGIPSPIFSASERQFLLSVLGKSSPAPRSSSNQPSCKKVLLDSL